MQEAPDLFDGNTGRVYFPPPRQCRQVKILLDGRPVSDKAVYQELADYFGCCSHRRVVAFTEALRHSLLHMRSMRTFVTKKQQGRPILSIAGNAPGYYRKHQTAS